MAQMNSTFSDYKSQVEELSRQTKNKDSQVLDLQGKLKKKELATADLEATIGSL